MKKTRFSTPLVILTGSVPGDESGSAIHDESIKPIPMSFEEWMQSRWMGDYDNNGVLNFDDYALWFSSSNFETTSWDNFNPGVVNNGKSDS